MALVSVICSMFVCVVPLSQPSSRDLVYPLLGCFVYEKSSIYIYIYKKLTRGLKNCKRHRIVNIILMEYITSSLSLSHPHVQRLGKTIG